MPCCVSVSPVSVDVRPGCACVTGTVIHFEGDRQKVAFKALHRGDSKPAILDTGLWAHSRHPNYFGDFLCYVAFFVVGGPSLSCFSSFFSSFVAAMVGDVAAGQLGDR